MAVTHYYLIGNMSVPSSWIASLLAFIIAYGAVRFRYGKQASLLVADTIFYFVIVWKFSVILTDFNTVLQFPLSILYFNGGTIGVFLGLLAASIKIILAVKKGLIEKELMMSLLTGTIFVQSIYQISMVLLNDGTLMIRLLTAVLFGLFVLFIWFFIEKFKGLPYQIILLFIGVHLFVAVLQPGGLLQTPVLATVYMGVLLMGVLYWDFVQEDAKEVRH